MTAKRTALYPGTFDPITNGHLDIMARGAKLVDELVIGVAINEGKKPLFSVEERVAMAKEELAPVAKATGTLIRVEAFDGLLVHFAESLGAQFILRGLRAVADFEYEYQMVGMNAFLNDDIETIFLMADPHHQAIASKLVKEIARLGGKINDFVPPAVEKALLAKFK